MALTHHGHNSNVGKAHLAGLLELRSDLGHHAHGGDEGEAGEDLGDPLAVHAEAVDLPVAGADGMLHAVCDSLLAEGLGGIELGHPVCLHQLLLSLRIATTSPVHFDTAPEEFVHS